MQMKQCSTCNDYSELFGKHAVYCDEPGFGKEPESCDGKEWTSFLEPNSWNHMNKYFVYKVDQEKSLNKVKEALVAKNITNLHQI